MGTVAMRGVWWAAAWLLLPSCGYTFGPLAHPDIRAIRVPLFRNDTRRREIEFQLTKAVTDELRRAGYRIAPPDGGDAVLLGRIAEVSESVLSEDASGALAEGRVTVAAEYRLVTSSGRELASGRAAEGGEVVFVRGEDRPAGQERAVAELARAIVRGLEPPPR